MPFKYDQTAQALDSLEALKNGPTSPSKVRLLEADFATGSAMMSPGGGEAAVAPGGAVQRNAMAGATMDPARVHAHAAHGVQGAGGPIPHFDQVQKAFGGHDLSGVRSHVSPEATRGMGAHAYASGNDVVFERQNPDVHTVAEECAHVVQQRKGVSLDNGVGKADDGYEQNAHQVADRVASGQSAEDLLGPPRAATQADQGAVQQRGVFGFTGSEHQSLELQVDIPIAPLVSAKVKVSGTFTQEKPWMVSRWLGNEPVTSVEATLYGGIHLNLGFLKLGVGLQGHVKFEKEGVHDMASTVASGLKEIIQWQMKKDLAAEFQATAAQLEAAFDHTHEYCLAQTNKLWMATHNGDWRKQAKDRSWLGELFSRDNIQENIENRLDWLDGRIGKIFDKFHVQGSVRDVVDTEALLRSLEGVANARDKATAQRQVSQASAIILGGLEDGKAASVHALREAVESYNDPTIGFEASLLLAGEAKLGLLGVSVGVRAAAGFKIEDQIGETMFDPNVKGVKFAELNANVMGYDMALSGEWTDDGDIDINFKAYKDAFALLSMAFGGQYLFLYKTAHRMAKLFDMHQQYVKSSGDPVGRLKYVSSIIGEFLTSEDSGALDSIFQREDKLDGGVEANVEIRNGELQRIAVKFVLRERTEVNSGAVTEQVLGVGLQGAYESGDAIEFEVNL